MAFMLYFRQENKKSTFGITEDCILICKLAVEYVYIKYGLFKMCIGAFAEKV